MEPRTLTWAKRIESIARIGLTFAKDPYELERYENLRDLAVEMFAAHVDGDGTAEPEKLLTLRQVLASQVGYPTPMVDVRALVRDGDGRVLLVRELSDGRWALPGGWADVGSSPAENAVREVAEEANVTVTARRLLAVLDRAKHPHTPSPNAVYKVCVACDLAPGEQEPKGGPETLDARFLALGALPELSLGRVTEGQIRRLVFLNEHPELPPDLD